jgi:hypothetical protein
VEAGHQVVIDGYRIQGSVTTFHLNMGWGGSWNGYYSLNNIEIGNDLVFNLLDYQSYTLNMIPSDRVDQRTKFEFGITLNQNRSLFFKEYVCNASWKGIAGNSNNISGYDVIVYDFKQDNYYFIENVAHTGQSNPYHHRFRISSNRIEKERERSYQIFARTVQGGYIYLLGCRLFQEDK